MRGRFSLWMHFPEAEKSMNPLVLAEAYMRFKDRYGLDFIKVSLSTDVFSNILRNVNKSSGVSNLDFENDERMKFYLESCRILKERSSVPVFFTLYFPATIVKDAFGGAFFHLAKEDVFSATKTVGKPLKNLIFKLNELGIGIFIANKIKGVVDYSMFFDLDADLVSEVREGIYHFHGYSEQAMDIIRNSALTHVSWEDRRISMEDIGDKVPVGGVNRDLLVNGRIEEVEREIKSLLDSRPDAIIGPNCALRTGTSDENLGRVSKIVREALSI